MDIEQLVIEVTRRCNMQCPHCLRGDAQNQDLDTEYVQTLFSKIDGIGTLTLSGGEPSLVPKIIKKIIKLAKVNKVDIRNFYVVTNAKKITKDFIFSMIDCYVYCSGNELSQLAWSNDAYHESMDTDNVRLLKTLSFASPRNSNDDAEYTVISEGRAYGFKDSREQIPEYFEYDKDQDCLTEGALYLNCDGNIITGCDHSYENQDHNIVCHVDDFCLDAIVESGVELELAVY